MSSMASTATEFGADGDGAVNEELNISAASSLSVNLRCLDCTTALMERLFNR